MLFNNLEQAEKLKTNQYITEVYWWVSQNLKSESTLQKKDMRAKWFQGGQRTASGAYLKYVSIASTAQHRNHEA